MPEHLEIAVERGDDGEVRCHLRGDVDLAGSDRLRAALEAILRSDATRLVIELRDVEFFDSSGLNLLLQIRLRAEAAGVPLILASPSSAVTRVFEITGADDVFLIRAMP